MIRSLAYSRIGSIWVTLVLQPSTTVTTNTPFFDFCRYFLDNEPEREKILNGIDDCLTITTASWGLARLSLGGVASTVYSIQVLLRSHSSNRSGELPLPSPLRIAWEDGAGWRRRGDRWVLSFSR
jgi:hypothetical protein